MMTEDVPPTYEALNWNCAGYRKATALRAVLWGLLLATLSLSPSIPVAAASTPEAPDYTRPEAWAAYPGTATHADDVPPGLSATHATGVPVFFVHPTTYLMPIIANTDFAPGGAVQAGVDATVLRFQASVFNGCCVVFAPRYRQASIRAITSNTPDAYEADELVRRWLTRNRDSVRAAQPLP